MLSDKTNILQLVSLMSCHGVVDVVLCPGSRNAPICHTISQLPQFNCHALTDERSAGFFAIGLALATHRTVAVCVTSGSALLNLHPAVAEAFYQQVPLLVISADRPMAWIGQMDGQTMPQPEALAGITKMSVNLPEVHTDEEAWFCNRLVNEALLECRHRTLGPVHINVPISEPLYQFHVEKLPEERVIRRIEGLCPDHLRQLADLLQCSEQRIVLLGQKPVDRQLRKPLLDGLDKAFVTLCEHLANPGPGSVALLLNDSLMDEVETACAQDDACPFSPDLVITVCGHVVNKRLKTFLRKHPPRQHWHVSADGSVADLFGCLTTVVEAKPFDFLHALACLAIPMDKNNDAYSTLWRKASLRSDEAIRHKKSDVADHYEIVRQLFQLVPEDAVIHLANSSSVRYAQSFHLPEGVVVCCNRGINGIEGSLSSAVGYATATPERPNIVVIGDLSFFYDQNALWNGKLPQNLHILLLNSGGGRIFETLPVPDDERSRGFICAKHSFTAEHVAKQYGLQYLHGIESLETFLNASQSVLLEV